MTQVFTHAEMVERRKDLKVKSRYSFCQKCGDRVNNYLMGVGDGKLVCGTCFNMIPRRIRE